VGVLLRIDILFLRVHNAARHIVGGGSSGVSWAEGGTQRESGLRTGLAGRVIPPCPVSTKNGSDTVR
jgi:hypothetical protein